MKNLFKGLALIAIVFAASSVRADIVFDDFATGSGALAGTSSSGLQVVTPNGYKRVTSTGGTSAANINGSIAGGTANFNMNAANGFFRMDYSGFGLQNLHSITKVLRFTIQATAGIVYKLTYITNGPNGNLVVGENYTGSGAAEVHGFNFGPFNGAKASNVTALTLRVTRDTGGVATSSVILSGNLTAVPELGSMTLLGLTGVAGYFVNRRRKSKLETV